MPPLKFSQQQIAIIVIAIVVIFGVGALIFFNMQKKTSSTQAVTLSVWGTSDKVGMNDLVSYYLQYNSSAKVTYTQIAPADYENALLRAFAAGTGPDVFEINNRSLPKWQSVLVQLPAAYATQFNLIQLQNDFPSVVQSDFVMNASSTASGIYALPLSIDTLAMIYNKDMFDSAGITSPPATWDDFRDDIVKLRVVNAQGQITRAGAAIGGSEASILSAPDILSLLMLQNGTTMVSNDLSSAKFAGDSTSPGLTAFNFYLQFANASSPYYTWNDAMGNDLQSFVNGNVAIMFGYHADLATIKAKAPFLKVGVAAMPQAKGATISISYPKYSGLAVYKGSSSVSGAWNFVLSLTGTANSEKIYTDATGAPPAFRSAIQAAMSDPNLSVFANQALTARSWYEVDDEKVEGILNSAIQNVLNGVVASGQALDQAQSAVSSLMFQYQH